MTEQVRMMSFEGKSGVKAQILEQLKAHRAADEIIQGVYWELGKGCAVGCTIHSRKHKDFEKQFNLPEWLARLEDVIFEGLPNDKAKDFPVELWAAIPEQKDLQSVKWRYGAFILQENVDRVLTLQINDEFKKQVVNSIKQALQVFEAAIRIGTWDNSAADSASCSAAFAAYYAEDLPVGVSAAFCAVRSAASATGSTPYSISRATIYSARVSAAVFAGVSFSAPIAYEGYAANAYEGYAAKLIQLLKETGK